MSVNKQVVVVGGIPLQIYSETSLDSTKDDIVALFVLHGRERSAKQIAPLVESIVKKAAEKRKTSSPSPELIVITFDQRNHGERLVSAQANYAWAKDDTNNDKHAIDMYAIQTGTSKDVSFLIDFLPPYLFPSGERIIKEFIVSGFSLGGHSTWITLRDDPRVRIGIPIIGCADYLSLISERATLSGLTTGPPHIPDSLKELVLRNDPVNSPYHIADSSNPFFGKKILALSGGIDKAVPWSHSVPFFEKLEVGPEGVKESVVSPGVGHTVTPEMLSRLVDFIWAHALKP